MALSVEVPKNLSAIKTKVVFNLTKRQIICFSGAAITSVPVYFLTRGILGTQVATLLLVAVALPFFFLAMYEKDGFPAEKILYFMVLQKILLPGVRPYRSENRFEAMKQREILEKEAETLEKNRKKLSFKERKRLLEIEASCMIVGKSYPPAS